MKTGQIAVNDLNLKGSYSKVRATPSGKADA
jgi:hypothetical protein